MSSGATAGLQGALLHARHAAYGPGEYVGQEGFMRASEILDLACRAGTAPGMSMLDLCCGVAGPGRLIAHTLGCDYLGVDASPGAIHVARERGGANCRFEVSRIPPLPAGQFDVVLLLETMLAFPDKRALLRGVASRLPPGGRFAFTIEEGSPLTRTEQGLMPAAETVWPMPLADLLSCLEDTGLRVVWQKEYTQEHQAVVDSLVMGFGAARTEFVRHPADPTFERLIAAHRLWGEWLGQERIRKFAFVTETNPHRPRG